MHQAIFAKRCWYLKAPKQTRPYPNSTSPLFWNLRPTRTHTTMATKIAETSEDDTSIFKQKPTQISFVKRSKINVTHLSRRNNATSAYDSSPSRSLSFSSPLESCSDIYAGPTSWLIVTLLFNVLFLWYFPLFLSAISLYSRSADIRPVHSNWALSSPCHYKTRPLTADWLQVCFGTQSDTAV